MGSGTKQDAVSTGAGRVRKAYGENSVDNFKFDEEARREGSKTQPGNLIPRDTMGTLDDVDDLQSRGVQLRYVNQNSVSNQNSFQGQNSFVNQHSLQNQNSFLNQNSLQNQNSFQHKYRGVLGDVRSHREKRRSGSGFTEDSVERDIQSQILRNQNSEGEGER